MTRRVVGCVVSVILAIFLLSCSNSPTLSSIQVTPSTASTAAGTPVQFTAMGLYTKSSHPTQTENITNSVTWASSSPAIAAVSSTGVATPLSAGTTNITATMSSFDGLVTGTATLTVTGVSTSGLVSLTIIPGNGVQSVYAVGETAQFLAIGNYSNSPATVDLTDSVTWLSSVVSVATINSDGLATATGCDTGSCTTTITASIPTGLGSADIVGTSSLTLIPGGGSSPQLAVYAEGNGTGTIVSSPTGINGNCVGACLANFPTGTMVTLTATPNTASGSTFGGWSMNCMPYTELQCTVIVNASETVVSATFLN
jgi:trimeric autotransporter adhesin